MDEKKAAPVGGAAVVSGVSMRPTGCNDSYAAGAKIPRLVKSLIATHVLRIARRLSVDHVKSHCIGLHGGLSAPSGTRCADDREITHQYTERAHFHLQMKRPDAIFPVGKYPHRVSKTDRRMPEQIKRPLPDAPRFRTRAELLTPTYQRCTG